MAALILSVIFSISASAYDVEVGGIFFNVVTKVKTAEVTKGDKAYTGNISIPELITVDNEVYNVISIGNDAFRNCSNLSSVIIPNSVTSIGNSAFLSCFCLASITIPNSVTRIGNFAFSGCKNITSVTIPNSVTTIGYNAFSGCSSLTSITIPNSVESIGYEAFKDCSSLTSTTIPISIKEIKSGTFQGCSSLTSITIPNSVTTIGLDAFSGCSSLISITIGNSVTSIDYNAFEGCKNIENVYCHAAKVPKTESNVFKDAYIEYATLHVHASAINAYKTTEPWSGFGTFKSIEGAEGDTKKCETPTISFIDGKLTFACATEDVEYISEVKCSDIGCYYTNEVPLSACYDITLYAMKTGYETSDIATAKLYWLTSSGSLEGNNISRMSMRGIAIQSADGFIKISGLDNNEKVSLFTVDSKSLGTATAMSGSVSFVAQTGTIVVAKIGKDSVKIAVE